MKLPFKILAIRYIETSDSQSKGELASVDICVNKHYWFIILLAVIGKVEKIDK